MLDILEGRLPLSDKAKRYIKMNLALLKKYGFNY
jgi:hypothetical protein